MPCTANRSPKERYGSATQARSGFTVALVMTSFNPASTYKLLYPQEEKKRGSLLVWELFFSLVRLRTGMVSTVSDAKKETLPEGAYRML